MLIFQPIAQQSFCGNTLFQQSLHLLNHTSLQPLVQSTLDATDGHLARNAYTYYYMLHIGQVLTVLWMRRTISLYLKSSNKTLTSLRICVVMQPNE